MGTLHRHQTQRTLVDGSLKFYNVLDNWMGVVLKEYYITVCYTYYSINIIVLLLHMLVIILLSYYNHIIT